MGFQLRRRTSQRTPSTQRMNGENTIIRDLDSHSSSNSGSFKGSCWNKVFKFKKSSRVERSSSLEEKVPTTPAEPSKMHKPSIRHDVVTFLKLQARCCAPGTRKNPSVDCELSKCLCKWLRIGSTVVIGAPALLVQLGIDTVFRYWIRKPMVYILLFLPGIVGGLSWWILQLGKWNFIWLAKEFKTDL
ncbi:hypothetical protein C8R43DRAFT_1199090 [Mycena crocata]|nr:hypothetical protein C8R43DRAFT_1199090 [Mycena crocata]